MHNSCGVLPQIGALNLRHVQKLLTGAAQCDAPAFHDVAVVGDLEGLTRVLLDQKDGFAFGLELSQRLENQRDELWREPKRGFIKQ